MVVGHNVTESRNIQNYLGKLIEYKEILNVQGDYHNT